MISYQTIVKRRRWKIVDIGNKKYWKFDRNVRKGDYVRFISAKRADKQIMIFRMTITMLMVVTIMLILITKTIFFAAVASGSMSPTFDKYDLVLIQNIDRNYKVGDIIIFENPDTAIPVAHRIKSLNNGDIQTAGDATGKADWWQLKKSDITGKAVLVGEKPVVIQKFGRYFIAEERGQTFGPFDYRTYVTFFYVVKLYGYGIAIICIILYVALEIRRINMIR
jgi:signal peptidase I